MFLPMTEMTCQMERRPMMKLRLMLMASLLVLGCKPAPAPEPAAPPAETEMVTPAPAGQTEAESEGEMNAAVPVEGITLDVLNWEETQALVAKNQGKIVVMDLWATYCPPCIKEFPNLVRLNREHGDQIACISVSADYEGLDDQPVDSYREKVMKFLTKQEATFQNVLLSVSADKLFGEKIRQQSLPVVFVYDRQGNLRGQFPDPDNPEEFTYQSHILPLVDKLLKE
jgi:Thiol-disulfide isomerase and thioredoxins